VNAGDALAVLALEPLRDGMPLSGRVSRRVSDEFLEMLARTIEGQATELGWRADNVVDLEPTDYRTSAGRWSPTWPPWPTTRPPGTAGRCRAWTPARSWS
jgi:hypothetical protein